MASAFMDPNLLQQLQAQLDQESDLRQKLRDAVKELEKQQRNTLSSLSRIHSTPITGIAVVLDESWASLQEQRQSIAQLKELTEDIPYWKYHSMWARELQTTCFLWILSSWVRDGLLMSLADMGGALGVPIETDTTDSFQLTIEEYLHALVSFTEELSRLAINSVTVGDFQRPLDISKVVKDIHAGFQLLNLKNDSLRRRADSIKYNIKKIEEVVYDLSLRGLLPVANNAG